MTCYTQYGFVCMCPWSRTKTEQYGSRHTSLFGGISNIWPIHMRYTTQFQLILFACITSHLLCWMKNKLSFIHEPSVICMLTTEMLIRRTHICFVYVTSDDLSVIWRQFLSLFCFSLVSLFEACVSFSCFVDGFFFISCCCAFSLWTVLMIVPVEFSAKSFFFFFNIINAHVFALHMWHSFAFLFIHWHQRECQLNNENPNNVDHYWFIHIRNAMHFSSIPEYTIN